MCSIHCIHHDTMMHMIIIQPKNLFFGSLVQTMNLLKLYENGWCRHGVVEKERKGFFNQSSLKYISMYRSELQPTLHCSKI